MPKIWENKESQKITGGDSPAMTFSFEVRDCPDRDAAFALVLSECPVMVFHPNGRALRFKSPDLTPLPTAAAGGWRAEVAYLPIEDPNQASVSFEIAAETQHITQALETVERYVKDGDEKADFRGAIGVEDGEPKGVDILARKLSFGWTIYVAKELVTTGYVKQLAGLVGCVNSAEFLDFPAGEVLFVGASGSRRVKDDDWEITMKFVHSANVDGLTIGEIEGVSKLGHDYLWVKYEPTTDNTARMTVPKPRQVNVERVYRFADLSPLNINV